jgi:hypothetical protein
VRERQRSDCWRRTELCGISANLAFLARYNQRSTIDDAPGEVREMLTRELSKDVRDPTKKTLRELADSTGISKSILGRYSLRLRKQRLYRHKLERAEAFAGHRVVTRFPDGRYVVSTRFDENGSAVNTSDDTEFLLESDLLASDLLIEILLICHPIRNPAASQSRTGRNHTRRNDRLKTANAALSKPVQRLSRPRCIEEPSFLTLSAVSLLCPCIGPDARRWFRIGLSPEVMIHPACRSGVGPQGQCAQARVSIGDCAFVRPSCHSA